MGTLADNTTFCSERDEIAGWLPPPDPFVALNYHFGMLLGVADFQCEQAYFRGKSRLHNAWLHGRGVVGGYEVEYDEKSGEVKVGPGLALDGAGRELLLDAEACASVSVWASEYEKSGAQPKLNPNGFDLQVVARVRTCLARPVPAIAVPCADTVKVTAYSRIAERVDIFFRLVPPPALGEAPPQDGEPFSLFPEPDTAVVLLAVITGIQLTKAGDGWAAVVDKNNVDNGVRSVLMSTSAIQELVLVLLFP